MLFSLKGLKLFEPAEHVKCCYATCRLDTYEFNAQDHSCPQIPSSVLVTCLNKEWCLQPRFQERDYGVCQAETSG